MGEGDRVVRVGLIKAVPKEWDLEANWATFRTLAVRARERGAHIVCTPECFLDGYVVTDEKGWTEERFLSIAQSLNGDNYLRRAREFALEHEVHVVFGFTERARGGCYNAAALIDDQGRLLGSYHKTHVRYEAIPSHHDNRYLAGEDLPVWETSLGRIGMMICADRRVPEVARTLRLRGAELIMNPSYGAWGTDNEHWMRTRSVDCGVFICFAHPSESLITDPEGRTVAHLQSNAPDVLIHDIDLADIPKHRMPDRRPELYEP